MRWAVNALCLGFFAACGTIVQEGASDDTAPKGERQTPEEKPGETTEFLFAQMCVGCHGLHGEISISDPPDIERFKTAIEDRMPLGQPERCVGDCATKLADYLFRLRNPEAECDLPAPQVDVRRLTREELRLSLMDILNLPEADVPISSLPQEPGVGAFDNGAEGVSTDVQFVRGAIETVRRAVRRSTALTCRPDKNTKNVRECTERSVATLLPRAWRKATSQGDIDAVLAFFDRQAKDDSLGATAAERASAAFESTLMYIFLHPNFLFLNREFGNTGALSPFERATRLSYFLWSAPPDAALLESLGTQPPGDDDQWRALAKRMLADPRANRFIDRFGMMWLGGREVAQKGLGDGFTASVRKSMVEQVRRTFEHFLQQNTPVSDMLIDTPAFVDKTLATHIGARIQPKTWQQSDITGRNGVLGLLAWLSVSGADDLSTVPVRGAFFLERFLCQEITPPPDLNIDLGDLEEGDRAQPKSVREIYEIHAVAPQCRGCHNMIDPIGLGFDNYDEFGRFRNKDILGFPIDASGAWRGDPTLRFNDAVGLGEHLAKDEAFEGCVVRQLFLYGIGRKAQGPDYCELQALADKVREQSLGLADTIVEITLLRAFTQHGSRPTPLAQ